MKKFEVRFMFDNSALKIVKFSTIENARSYYYKVKRTANKAKKHGKVAIWNDGWLEMGECF